MVPFALRNLSRDTNDGNHHACTHVLPNDYTPAQPTTLHLLKNVNVAILVQASPCSAVELPLQCRVNEETDNHTVE